MSDKQPDKPAGLWLGPVTDAPDFAEAANDGLTFWKDVMTVGEYVDPKTGTPFGITPQMYADLETSFAAMKAINDEPPVLAGHHDPKDAQRHTPRELLDRTLGYVTDLRRSGDKLQAKVRFADEDAKRLGIKHKVSVRTVPNVTLSDGSKHPYALTHLALTNRPVLSKGMNDWSLALSRDGEGDGSETYFAAPTPSKESHMTPDQLTRAKTLVPNATDADAVDLLLSYAEQEAKNGKKTDLELSQVTKERDDLLKAKPLELSQSDRMYGKRAIVGDLAEITKAWPQAAKDAVTKYATDANRIGLMLSQVGDDRIAFDDLADLLKAIPLKGLRNTEQTGVQHLELSNAHLTGDDKPDVAEQVKAELSRTELGRRALAAQAK